MKTTSKFLVTILMIGSLTNAFGQEPLNQQATKSKSNISNNISDIDETSAARQQKAWLPSNFRTEFDANGNEMVFLPTSPKPTILALNTASNTYEVVSPKDLATGQASGKRMHKPFVFTKELDNSSAAKGISEKGLRIDCDNNGELDISSLGEGAYRCCPNGNTTACFTFSIDSKGQVAYNRTYTGGR